MTISSRSWGGRIAWLVAPLVCLAVYWQALQTWFYADDFAYLGLHHDVVNWRSFLDALFTPTAQGTLRPLGDRLFFLVFWRLFGLDALCYHIWIFLTQAANLALLYWILVRMTRSRVAGALGASLWGVGAGLSEMLRWTCGYNEILCATFLLGALALWIKFQETRDDTRDFTLDVTRDDTREWRYYWLQTAAFIAGFGALELNLVYPALAASYAVFVGRARDAMLTAPLFVISGGYYVLHARITPPQLSGPYAAHFDLAMAFTTLRYWVWNFVSPFWRLRPGYLLWGSAFGALMSLAIVAFLVAEMRAKRYGALFFASWFVVTIAVFAPLRDHASEYYLAIPSIGPAAILAMMAARHRAAWALALLYAAAAIFAGRAETRLNYEISQKVRDLVLGVRRALELHPGKDLLLTHVSTDLYQYAITDRPFRVFTDRGVYLAPEMLNLSGKIDVGRPPVELFALPPGPTAHALKNRQLVVYSAEKPRLKNETVWYAALAKLSHDPPRLVDVAEPLDAYLLGEGWFRPEGNFRWMGKRASVTVGGPVNAAQKLMLKGVCVAELARQGPPVVQVLVDEFTLPEAFPQCTGGPFEASFALPASLLGKASLRVEVEVNHTFTDAGRTRDLGLAFGTFQVR